MTNPTVKPTVAKRKSPQDLVRKTVETAIDRFDYETVNDWIERGWSIFLPQNKETWRSSALTLMATAGGGWSDFLLEREEQVLAMMGFNPDVDCASDPGSRQSSALEAAAAWGRESMVVLLARWGASLGPQGEPSTSALPAALIRKKKTQQQWETPQKAKEQRSRLNGSRALRAANGRVAISLLLMELGARPNGPLSLDEAGRPERQQEHEFAHWIRWGDWSMGKLEKARSIWDPLSDRLASEQLVQAALSHARPVVLKTLLDWGVQPQTFRELDARSGMPLNWRIVDWGARASEGPALLTLGSRVFGTEQWVQAWRTPLEQQQPKNIEGFETWGRHAEHWKQYQKQLDSFPFLKTASPWEWFAFVQQKEPLGAALRSGFDPSVSSHWGDGTLETAWERAAKISEHVLQDALVQALQRKMERTQSMLNLASGGSISIPVFPPDLGGPQGLEAMELEHATFALWLATRSNLDWSQKQQDGRELGEHLWDRICVHRQREEVIEEWALSLSKAMIKAKWAPNGSTERWIGWLNKAMGGGRNGERSGLALHLEEAFALSQGLAINKAVGRLPSRKRRLQHAEERARLGTGQTASLTDKGAVVLIETVSSSKEQRSAPSRRKGPHRL